jgi:hypothetical protein
MLFYIYIPVNLRMGIRQVGHTTVSKLCQSYTLQSVSLLIPAKKQEKQSYVRFCGTQYNAHAQE